MSKLAVYNKEGKEAEQFDLPDSVFDQRINKDVLHQCVVMYQAALRQGTASTKERGSVSGGGKKPYRQKGTGRARAGSSRSPLWTGGGVVFGPHPRDYKYSVPKKIKKAALRESLKVKYQDERLMCVQELKEALNKTKEFVTILGALKIKGKILALLDGSDESIIRVSRNIRLFHIMRSDDVNAYDILKNKNLLVTKTALEKLLKRVEI